MNNGRSHTVDEIMARAESARSEVARLLHVGSFVDTSLSIPRPYVGLGAIRLVIIGQDPTVQNEAERARIRTVLNLDKRGGLLRYLATLCSDLGVSLRDEVYATNACKNFWIRPPTAIEEVDVLALSAPFWLPLLRAELDRFPDATVISLGQPVLSMLVRDGSSRQMRDYWGYHPRWRAGEMRPMHAIEPDETTVGRRIFPFVHQPSLRGGRAAFYRARWAEYVKFVRKESALHCLAA